MSRAREVVATREQVWELVADPHNLPRWWPRAQRVEDVRGATGRMRWTTVLATERGAPVRADFRCRAASRPARIAWEQEIAGTPFERVLRASSVEIEIEPAAGGGAEVRLTADERLRGLARLGSRMIRGAAKRRLEEALDGIEMAVGER